MGLPWNKKKTKKHTDWTPGLKCEHQVWSWLWPWIFKVKYRIWYFSAKNGRIAMKQKANISMELEVSNVSIGFDLDHDLERQGLKIYCIVTRVISVVSVPLTHLMTHLIISPVSEGSGDVMVLRRSRPPPAARNGVNAITKKPRDGLFSNLVYALVVIVSWPD